MWLKKIRVEQHLGRIRNIIFFLTLEPQFHRGFSYLNRRTQDHDDEIMEHIIVVIENNLHFASSFHLKLFRIEFKTRLCANRDGVIRCTP